MARYTDSVCRLCRREGTKLFLKGERCYTEKCGIERRNQPPGQHAKASKFRLKGSEYATQLREKQKMKRTYGVLERQFRKYFIEADRMRGITGENLVQLLERRLDNVVYRTGFATSRREARQMIRHGHFDLNGHMANIPSISVRLGDKISIRTVSKEHPAVKTALEFRKGLDDKPVWLERNDNELSVTIARLPERADVTQPFEEQLIVELYSK